MDTETVWDAGLKHTFSPRHCKEDPQAPTTPLRAPAFPHKPEQIFTTPKKPVEI